jgi:hypothetical protein
MNEKTNVFISYAHEDTAIAHEIKDQLTLLAQSGMGGSSLDCFLDADSIPPGVKYEPIIKAALEQADWLVVVFTGNQSVYCGYEIGMYSILKSLHDRPADDKRVACLHDVEQRKLPAVVDGYNTTHISQVAPYVPPPPNELTSNAKIWWDSPVGKLLRAICTTKGLYTPADRENDPVQYQIDIAQSASKIAAAFEDARKEDELWEAPVQAGLEIVLFPPSSQGQRIPPQSTVLGSSRSFDILGMGVPYDVGSGQVPHTTWGELRQALSTPGRVNIPWMDRLETNIGLAVASKVPQPDDVTFRGSGQDRRIYRAVLTRHKLYGNGKRRFYVLLVETFDRRFVGDPDTSLLLTALMLGSRWRFTFFERWHDTLKQFDESRSDVEFMDACKQFEYNMEWIENEGVELGADNLESMERAFGAEHKARIDRFFSDFYKAKDELKTSWPHSFEKAAPEKRREVHAAILKFLTIVKEQNAEFLKLCVRTYAERLGAAAK